MIDEMRQIYKQLIEKFDGLEKSDFVKLTLNDREFKIRLFIEYDWPNLFISFFLPGQKYSRKDLCLSPDGFVTEDDGIIPDFDKVEDEPVFTQTNEELLELAAQHLLDS